MKRTLETRLKKLEAKKPVADDNWPQFQVYLVKESKKKPGTFLRRAYPDGKYQTVDDPQALGITPYTPREAPTPNVVITTSPIPAPHVDTPIPREEHIQHVRELAADLADAWDNPKRWVQVDAQGRPTGEHL